MCPEMGLKACLGGGGSPPGSRIELRLFVTDSDPSSHRQAPPSTMSAHWSLLVAALGATCAVTAVSAAPSGDGGRYPAFVACKGKTLGDPCEFQDMRDKKEVEGKCVHFMRKPGVLVCSPRRVGPEVEVLGGNYTSGASVGEGRRDSRGNGGGKKGGKKGGKSQAWENPILITLGVCSLVLLALLGCLRAETPCLGRSSGGEAVTAAHTELAERV